MHQDDALQALNTLLIQLSKIKEEINIPNDETFNQLPSLIEDMTQHKDSAVFDCQQWLGRIFNFYPQLTPLIPRSLLWFVGGECLHYLTDEELNAFQQLDNHH